MVLQHRRRKQPVQGRAGPAGAELLHRPRRPRRFLNGTAEPSVGWLKASDPNFGNPQNRYKLDPQKGKALLEAAGYTAKAPLALKAMISTSGSGQMQPLPMNEFLQESLKQNCNVDVSFNVVEWQVLLNAARRRRTRRNCRAPTPSTSARPPPTPR